MFVSPGDRAGRGRRPLVLALQPSIYPLFVRPINEQFAWVNQGGATTTVNANGGINLLAPANAGDSIRIRKKPAPPTPYTIQAAFLINLVNVDSGQCGLCYRQSSDGKLVLFEILRGDTLTENLLRCSDWTNPTTFSASNKSAQYQAGINSLIWMEISDNGTNRIVRWSVNGYNFFEFLSESRTNHLTADEIGFYANTATASWPAACTLLHWKDSF